MEKISLNYFLPQQKKTENEEAFKHFRERLVTIDNLDGREKTEELVRGVLTGNIFDWGAKEVATLMENTNFSFRDAQLKIPGSHLFTKLFYDLVF